MRGSATDFHSAIAQYEFGRLGLFHQRPVMRCDQNAGTQTVEFHKKAQQPRSHFSIYISSRLVSQQ